MLIVFLAFELVIVSNANSSFSNVRPNENPRQWPWRAITKLFVTYPSGSRECSGALIDSKHVFTSGMCVFDKNKGGTAISIEVIPAYDRGEKPFGNAMMESVRTNHEWFGHQEYNWNFGLIRVGRPVGALTGWHGLGSNRNPDDWKDNLEWHCAGYPYRSTYKGDVMQEFHGKMDKVPVNSLSVDSHGDPTVYWAPNTVGIDWQPSYPGMFGSGVTSSDFIQRAVLSDRSGDKTWFARLDNTIAQDFEDKIHSVTPPTPDLIPLAVEAYGTTIIAGEQLINFRYRIHNYSSQPWSGTIDVDVYLSDDDFISASDTFLRSYTPNLPINDKGTLDITQVVSPIIPEGTPEGEYFIGIILDVSDYDTGNNASHGQDAWKIFVSSSCNTFGDTDDDGICDDGDGDNNPGNNPCIGGNTVSCDDNCFDTPNGDQGDADYDGEGDICGYGI